MIYLTQMIKTLEVVNSFDGKPWEFSEYAEVIPGTADDLATLDKLVGRLIVKWMQAAPYPCYRVTRRGRDNISDACQAADELTAEQIRKGWMV